MDQTFQFCKFTAWQNRNLANAKRLPELKNFLDIKSEGGQTPDEQLEYIIMLNQALGGKDLRHGRN